MKWMTNLLRPALAAALLLPLMATAQTDKPARIGRMLVTDFEQRQIKAREQLAAVVVNKVALQSDDLKTVNKLAIIALRQQAIAQALSDKLVNEELKMLAAAQLQAQTALLELLQKFSAEKKFVLPTAAEAKAPQKAADYTTQNLKLMEKSYLLESGVKAHQEQLELAMGAKGGREANFKAMGTQAVNLIKTLAQVADQLQQKLYPLPVY